jgi:hypothetical protein
MNYKANSITFIKSSEEITGEMQEVIQTSRKIG